MRTAKISAEKNQIGRGVHFFVFQTPKTFWSRSRPAARLIVPRVFLAVTGKLKITQGGTPCRS